MILAEVIQEFSPGVPPAIRRHQVLKHFCTTTRIHLHTHVESPILEMWWWEDRLISVDLSKQWY